MISRCQKIYLSEGIKEHLKKHGAKYAAAGLGAAALGLGVSAKEHGEKAEEHDVKGKQASDIARDLKNQASKHEVEANLARGTKADAQYIKGFGKGALKYTPTGAWGKWAGSKAEEEAGERAEAHTKAAAETGKQAAAMKDKAEAHEKIEAGHRSMKGLKTKGAIGAAAAGVGTLAAKAMRRRRR